MPTRGAPRSNSVKLNLPASLAARWLVRLPPFHGRHRPARAGNLNGHLDLDDRHTDVAIWLGSANWPGLRAERLLDLEAFPVCSAAFLVGNAVPSAPTELVQFLCWGSEDGRIYGRTGFATPTSHRTTRVRREFDDLRLLYRAAACGLGAPLDCPFRLAKGYYIV
jgi:DNA-binding transcriptional LysR family regulator